MQRHPVDLVSFLLGAVALGWAVLAGLDLVTPEWYTADTARAVLVLAPTVLLVVGVAQFLAWRAQRRRASETTASETTTSRTAGERDARESAANEPDRGHAGDR